MEPERVLGFLRHAWFAPWPDWQPFCCPWRRARGILREHRGWFLVSTQPPWDPGQAAIPQCLGIPYVKVQRTVLPWRETESVPEACGHEKPS